MESTNTPTAVVSKEWNKEKTALAKLIRESHTKFDSITEVLGLGPDYFDKLKQMDPDPIQEALTNTKSNTVEDFAFLLERSNSLADFIFLLYNYARKLEGIKHVSEMGSRLQSLLGK